MYANMRLLSATTPPLAEIYPYIIIQTNNIIDKHRDKQTDRQTDRRTDGRTDGRTGGRADGRADGRTDGRTDGQTDRQTERRQARRYADRYTDIQTDNIYRLYAFGRVRPIDACADMFTVANDSQKERISLIVSGVV